LPLFCVKPGDGRKNATRSAGPGGRWQWHADNREKSMKFGEWERRLVLDILPTIYPPGDLTERKHEVEAI